MPLRISAGDQKGRLLRAPRRAQTRPTASRVRSALFNILGDRVIGATWLDLYAGSGITGLEALCRGAAWATFVDSDADARRCITHNIQTLGYHDRAEVYAGSVERFLHDRPARPAARMAPQPFDLVFADPPYRQNRGAPLFDRLLLLCHNSGKIAPHAWIIVEHAATIHTPLSGGRWRQVREYTYGDSALTVYGPGDRET